MFLETLKVLIIIKLMKQQLLKQRLQNKKIEILINIKKAKT